MDSLLASFWQQVTLDLAGGGKRGGEAAAWLEGPDFEGWARLTLPSVEPDELRALLEERARTVRPWRGREWQAA